jgi:hypothetical protein
LISAIIFFGPFIRRCIPSGTEALPGTSVVGRVAVKMYPLAHPGIETRAESFGTGFGSCADNMPIDMAAAIRKVVVVRMMWFTLD